MNKNDKQKLAIIAVALSIIPIYISYNQWQLDVQTNQASIDYGISTNYQTRFYNDSECEVNAWCRNGGGMDGSFFLFVTFKNATVSSQLSSYRVNSTLVQIPFVLHKSGVSGDTGSLNIPFTIDNGVRGFSISISLEKRDQNPLKANPFQYQILQCNWSSQDRCYAVVS